MSRLTSHVWVSAYLARLEIAAIPAFIVAKGDPGAGAVLVKSNTLDGHATLFQREINPLEGTRRWATLVAGAETEIDEAIARQNRIDPDLWVIEVEDRHGRTLLDEPGLDE